MKEIVVMKWANKIFPRVANSGFTLVEIIVFVVGLGVLAGTILVPFATVMRNTPKAFDSLSATELAKARMEVILGQYRTVGFTSFQDVCTLGSPPPICAASSNPNYTITSLIGAAAAPNGNSNYKQITVTVRGNSNVGNGYAQLITMVSNYNQGGFGSGGSGGGGGSSGGGGCCGSGGGGGSNDDDGNHGGDDNGGWGDDNGGSGDDNGDHDDDEGD